MGEFVDEINKQASPEWRCPSCLHPLDVRYTKNEKGKMGGEFFCPVLKCDIMTVDIKFNEHNGTE